MKKILVLLVVFCQLGLAQNRDISYMSSGGKLHPLQANMDIRHYTIILDVDIDKKTMTVYPDDDKTKMSPERTLLHEIHHAVNDLVKKSLKKDSRSKPIEPLMDSREEETVITETDQQFLKRKNHYGLPMSENSCSSCTDGQLIPGLKTGSKIKPGLKVLTLIVKDNEEMP